MLYTCNTCSLQFRLPEDQRKHMKSDWHRYNLKRRVAGLPAIEEFLFNDKVQKMTQVDEDEQKKEKPQKEKQITKKEQRRRDKEELLEKKRQLLEIAKQNMLKSMKEDTTAETAEVEQITKDVENIEIHTTSVAEVESAPEVEAVPEVEVKELTEEQEIEMLMEEKLKNKVEIPLENCLFCNKKFPYFEACCTHMFKYHGFYIPEQEYLTDKQGLVRYMAEKIGVGNVCIVCGYEFRSLEAVRAHMLSKKHCRIPYESEDEKLEISEYFDFTSTYKDLDASADGEWEDVDEEDGSVVGSDDDIDEVLPQQVSYNDGVELHLPTGVKIGHRALARYYRQNLRPETVLSEGQGTIIAAESRHLAAVHDRQALMERKRTWNIEKSHLDRDDRKAAKFVNNQPHYRDQLLQ